MENNNPFRQFQTETKTIINTAPVWTTGIADDSVEEDSVEEDPSE